MTTCALSLRPADVLLVVPPTAVVHQPSIGVHILQACAMQAGFKVTILYGNLILTEMIGEELYQKIVSKESFLFRERLFGPQAFGIDPLPQEHLKALDLEELAGFEKIVDQWLDVMESIIFQHDYPIIGCTSSYEQTCASLALLKRCKERNSALVTIMGGSNCEGDMAEGVLSLKTGLDYAFSGESEQSFVQFLEAWQAGALPKDPVIEGIPCMNMNSLPMNDYTEYFEQLAVTLPDLAEDPDDIICIPYETSRGCWWGQKHHCTFCGLNGLTMAFRQKTPELAINEFDELFNTWPVTRINVADNIMPHTYFKTLVPALAKSNSKEISIFYEQKSNLSLKKILALRDAGINRIQPGIESLSTSQLKRMDKGVTAHQNLNLLRYARSAGVHVAWNLLVGFPGDQEEDYQEIIDLFPLISHLEPPGGVYKVVFDRFSPYFMEPEKYGVRNLRPSGPYYKHYPEYTDYFKLAYHFEADIDSAMVDKPELVESLRHLQKQWKQIWWPGTEAETPRPNLIVSHLYGDQYALADTRGLPESEPYTYLNGKQVSIVLRGCDIGVGSSDWALERKLIFEIDGRLAPLATSSPELISHFEMVAADPQLKVG